MAAPVTNKRLDLYRRLLQSRHLQRLAPNSRLNPEFKSRDEGLEHFVEEVCECNPKSLDAAAKFFGLDPAIPPDREIMAYIMAEVLFGTLKRGRRKGDKPAWNKKRHLVLAYLHEQKRRESPSLSDAKIAELIPAHKEFKHDDPEQIRQHLGAARRQLEKMRRRHEDGREAQLRHEENPESAHDFDFLIEGTMPVYRWHMMYSSFLAWLDKQ